MNTRTALSTIAALGALGLSAPALAQAAPAKLAATPSAGGVTVKITNANRYAVTGNVALVSRKTTIASKRTAVAGRKSKTISLSGRGLRSATLVVKLGRRGAKPSTTRRAVTLGGIRVGGGQVPGSIAPGSPAASSGAGGASMPPSGGSTPPPGDTTGGNPGPDPDPDPVNDPPPAPNPHWTATDLTYGGTFGITVESGQLSLDGSYLMPVFCQEAGGQGRWAWSDEVIDEYQNWTLGNQYGTRYRDTPRVNLYAGSSDHRVTYKITSQKNGNTISGTISQSFAAPRWENGHTVVFDCSGSLSYSATQ